AARKVSSLYDQFLSASGLTNTQYSILINVARAGSVSRTALAERLGMERTTLTRNIRPLEQAKWIEATASDDRRERLLRLSPNGTRKLRQSYALWEEAQKAFQAEIGKGVLEQLRKTLK